MKALLMLACLLLGGYASGQTISVPKPLPDTTALTATRLTAADTVRALHHLFSDRRTGGKVLLASALGIVVVGAGIASTQNTSGSFVSGPALGLLAAAELLVLTLPLSIGGASLKNRYSAEEEKAVIADFTASRVLPRKYRRALVPSFFSQPATN